MSKFIKNILSLVFVVAMAVSGWQFWQTQNLGDSLKKNGAELYYSEAAGQAKANELLSYLDGNGYLDGTPKTFKLDRNEGGRWQFSVVPTNAGAADIEAQMEAAARELSGNVFQGDEVEIHLLDENLETLRVLAAVADLPFEKVEHNGVQVRYTASVDKAVAERLMTALAEDPGHDGSSKTIKLDRTEAGTWQVYVVLTVEESPEVDSMVTGIARTLSGTVFNGEELEMHLCDAYLLSRRVLPPVGAGPAGSEAAPAH